jgi:hypothetical protein
MNEIFLLCFAAFRLILFLANFMLILFLANFQDFCEGHIFFICVICHWIYESTAIYIKQTKQSDFRYGFLRPC